MSESERVLKAADLIWQAWQAGEALEPLPGDLVPADRAEAYRVQAVYEERSKYPLFGWKIAATSAAGQGHIGVDGPLAGRLLAERVSNAGSVLPLAGNRMRVAEPEFAFRLGRDLDPQESDYSVDAALEAVDTLHLAIEVPDSRFSDFASVGAVQLIVDNACAHDFVFGPPVAADWRALDLAQHPVQAAVVGKDEHTGSGANVLGDPRVALAWLVNEVTRLGITLKSGQVITTGTAATPLPIVEGDRVEADFGALGTISVQFS